MPDRDRLLVLAIESSCDETAVAILRGFSELLVSLVASQTDIHAEFGGVVPEVASRNHLRDLPPLVQRALADANLRLDQIDAFAATSSPGLAPALLVGLSHAKGLAIGTGKPFLAVNHIEGHLLSPFFGEEIIPPHVALVVSGGHTLLVDATAWGDYSLLGTTLDDAAGEAFDKVAKLLGLPYPGGILLDRLAEHGNPARFSFPRGMIDSRDFAFSFSGLKTAVRYTLEKINRPTKQDQADLCASFREAVVDVLVAKALQATRQTGRSLLAVSGGVSANKRLRERLEQSAASSGIELRLAPDQLRTDNAAMIAFAAAHALRAGQQTDLNTDISPTLSWLTHLSGASNQQPA